MPVTYLDAAALAFGSKEFTVEDFRRRIASPRAAKLLNELKTRGAVERTGRGRYRLLAPDERPDLRAAEWSRVRSAILGAPMEKAWSGPTAVEAWTLGRYRVSPSAFRRDFFVAIPKTLEVKWRAYLKARGVSVDGRRAIGSKVVLEPRTKLRIETVAGEPVIPRSETLKLIRKEPGLFGDAEALLA